MIYAERGVGKTHLALGVACAVATGQRVLQWSAPTPRGVLYLDGEMSAADMQARLKGIIAAMADCDAELHLNLITPDLQPCGMPDLATEAGQAVIDEHITDEIDLIIVDNISTLARSTKENDADSWVTIQTWALKWRAAGKTVLFIHHAGKGGRQRGTSRREDVLDTVIALRRPKDYKPEEGAVFQVEFEKARGLCGDDCKPFEARLKIDADGRSSWTTRSIEQSTYDKVVALTHNGLEPQEIAEELGIHKSSVSRHLKTARQQGGVKGGHD